MKGTDNNKQVKYPACQGGWSVPGKGHRGRRGVAILNSVVSTGLSEITASEQRHDRGGEPCSHLEESVCGEGTASSNTLGQECLMLEEQLSEVKSRGGGGWKEKGTALQMAPVTSDSCSC